MNNNNEWCLIESDPGVFTELLEQIGVKGVELEEIWSLDDECLAALPRLHGLIFLFQWTGQDTSVGERVPVDSVPGLFFAKQVTTNACATQALLSIVLNTSNSTTNGSDNGSNDDVFELGEMLTQFKAFTESFPPDLKGESIGNSKELQKAHNSFARKDAFLHEGRQITPTGNEDIFHFVAYLPHDGKVYELDGLQSGPIVVGDVLDETPWYVVARKAVQERMNAAQGVKFNLMAVTADRRQILEAKKARHGDDDDKTPEYATLVAELAQQQAKREGWKLENERRRHNYVPLCIQLLKELARNQTLPQLVSQAQERVQEKRKAKQENKKE